MLWGGSSPISPSEAPRLLVFKIPSRHSGGEGLRAQGSCWEEVVFPEGRLTGCRGLGNCQRSRSIDGDPSCQWWCCFYGGEVFWRSVLAIHSDAYPVSTANPRNQADGSPARVHCVVECLYRVVLWNHSGGRTVSHDVWDQKRWRGECVHACVCPLISHFSESTTTRVPVCVSVFLCSGDRCVRVTRGSGLAAVRLGCVAAAQWSIVFAFFRDCGGHVSHLLFLKMLSQEVFVMTKLCIILQSWRVLHVKFSLFSSTFYIHNSTFPGS